MKKTKKSSKKEEVVVDEELKAIALELNEFMKEKGVALLPFIRPVISPHGFKTGEVASVELVRHDKAE